MTARGFASIGRDVRIYDLARILQPEQITVGDSVIIDDYTFLVGGTGMTIGSFVHIGAFTSVMGGGEFTMGDFAGLSGGVRVYTGNEDYLGGSLTNPAVPHPWRVAERSYVHIGKHAIIGANAVILPGVTIGEGAVVGALSMVTRDLDPFTINIGTPARRIRERPRDRILQLEEELRASVYQDGRYIPASERQTP